MNLYTIELKPCDKHRYKVLKDYAFELNGFRGIVKKGYTSDGATIPRLFWSFWCPFKSEYIEACVIHDWLCSKAMHCYSIKEAYMEADLVFLYALERSGVGKITRLLFYNFVKAKHLIKCYIKGWK